MSFLVLAKFSNCAKSLLRLALGCLVDRKPSRSKLCFTVSFCLTVLDSLGGNAWLLPVHDIHTRSLTLLVPCEPELQPY